MSKYEALGTYLRRQAQSRIPMAFSEIEDVLNQKLPASKRHRAWWSNNPSNNVMTREWLAAGYETEAVDVEGERLVFRRVVPAGPNASRAPDSAPPRHPIFGCMAGSLTVNGAFDLTQPAGAEWSQEL